MKRLNLDSTMGRDDFEDKDYKFLQIIKMHCAYVLFAFEEQSYDDFKNNDFAQKALAFIVIQIGNCVKSLSNNILLDGNKCWSGAVGARNVLAHMQYDLDPEALWDILKVSIPELAKIVQTYDLQNSES